MKIPGLVISLNRIADPWYPKTNSKTEYRKHNFVYERPQLFVSAKELPEYVVKWNADGLLYFPSRVRCGAGFNQPNKFRPAELGQFI